MIVKTCICGWNDIHTILTHNLGIEILFDGYLVNVEYLFLFVLIQNAKDVEIKKMDVTNLAFKYLLSLD